MYLQVHLWLQDDILPVSEMFPEGTFKLLRKTFCRYKLAKKKERKEIIIIKNTQSKKIEQILQ